MMRGLLAVVLSLSIGATNAQHMMNTGPMGRPGMMGHGMMPGPAIIEERPNMADSSTQTETLVKQEEGLWDILTNHLFGSSIVMEVESGLVATNSDWKDAVNVVKTLCSQDFDAICGDLGSKSHHRHHHGHMMRHGGKHGKHMNHHRRMQGATLPAGPLGFGSAVADQCLLDHYDELSYECSDAIQTAQAMYMTLEDAPQPPPPSDDSERDDDDDHHHHHAAAGLCLLVLVVALSTAICCCLPHKGCCRGRVLLNTLAENPELKQALEEASGTPIPLPEWHKKIRAALEANPDLKVAVNGAMNDYKSRPENKNHTCLLVVLCLSFLLLLVFMPFLGFAMLAIMLMGSIAILIRKYCCAPRQNSQMQETTAQPVQVISTNIPVVITTSEVQKTEKSGYVPPPLVLSNV